MNNRKKHLMTLCLTAMFTALTTIVTMYLHIDTPTGYINIGDSVILIASTILGPIPGLFIGGFGSCIADLATGHALWAVPTLIIKGIEGFLCGVLTYYIFRHTSKRIIKLLFTALASLLSATVMLFGYFFANYIMNGIGMAIQGLVGDVIQASVSFTINILAITALIKTPIFNGDIQMNLLGKLDLDRQQIIDIESLPMEIDKLTDIGISSEGNITTDNTITDISTDDNEFAKAEIDALHDSSEPKGNDYE